jgi:hypothetical protein
MNAIIKINIQKKEQVSSKNKKIHKRLFSSFGLRFDLSLAELFVCFIDFLPYELLDLIITD